MRIHLINCRSATVPYDVTLAACSNAVQRPAGGAFVGVGGRHFETLWLPIIAVPGRGLAQKNGAKLVSTTLYKKILSILSSQNSFTRQIKALYVS
jgi:hypothetical protein